MRLAQARGSLAIETERKQKGIQNSHRKTDLTDIQSQIQN